MVRRPAYTLIEMIVVIGLLATLASFIVPTYQLIIAQLQLSTSVSQVSDLLRLSEQRTVTEQLTYGVTLNPGATAIVQSKVTSAGPPAVLVAISTITLPPAITVEQVNFGSSSLITFTTAGAPSVSGNLVLLDSTRNRRRQISIRPSGAVMAGPEY